MKLLLISESGYDHSKTTIPVPDLRYEFRQDREDANQWSVMPGKLQVDTQLIPILYKLWDAGFMTIGSCRGSTNTRGSGGYLNFVGKPIPKRIMPQLRRPQKTLAEIAQFCRHAAAGSNCLSTDTGPQAAFLSWSWDNFDCAIADIEKAL